MVSFKQVYFSTARRPNAEHDAKTALVLISTGNNPVADIGDPLLLDAEFKDVDQRTVASLFGADFAKAIFAMSPHAWQGPVASGYGLHLVEVTANRPAETRPFDSVREQVVTEWRRQRETEIKAAYLAKLKDKYGVDFDESVKPLLQGIGQ